MNAQITIISLAIIVMILPAALMGVLPATAFADASILPGAPDVNGDSYFVATKCDALSSDGFEKSDGLLNAEGTGIQTSKTPDEAIAWARLQLGKTVGSGQCVAFVKAYYAYLGMDTSGVWGNAKDYATNYCFGWERVQGGVPQKGDILVYSISSNGYGHVAICESAASIYEQNYNDCGIVQHHTWGYNSGYEPGYWGYIRPNWASSGHNPVGWLDTAVGGDGTVTVSGWAFDPDNPNASIEVHIYVGGDSASGEGRNGIIANLQRDDVNKAYGISGKHGFKATFSTNKRGSVAVYAYGINVGAGSNARLDNSITTTVTYPPQGWLDGATGGKGTITVKGWALDRDYPTRNLEVQIYVGAPAPSGELHGGIIANVSSPDVTQTTGVQGNHRFSTTFRTNKTGNLTLYAYAVNPVSGQPNSLLLGTQTVNVSSPDSQTMYRLYNPWSGEHLFTLDKSEYDKLGKIGWKQESEAWKSPTSGTKVYRLYNKYSGDHHYTTDANEYATLGRIGWTQEGVAFYSGGSRKVYRGFNPYEQIGTHHYTTDKNEIDTMVRNGWKDEGVGWYCS